MFYLHPTKAYYLGEGLEKVSLQIFAWNVNEGLTNSTQEYCIIVPLAVPLKKYILKYDVTGWLH